MPKRNAPLQIAMGKRIAKLRGEAHLRQEELAERAGLSTNFLAQVEQGVKGIGADSIVRIAQALGTSTDYLLLGEIRKDEAGRVERLLAELTESQRESSVKILEILIEAIGKEERV